MATGIAETYVEETLAHAQTSLWADAWRRLRRNRLALASTVFLVLLTLVAIVAQFWTPYSYFAEGIAPVYQGLSAQHLLGVDDLGRDILSRIMLGAQVSLKVGIGTQVVVIVVGVVVGLLAGFYRGVLDTVISTVINIFYGIPDLLVALTLVLLLGRSLGIIIFAIAFEAFLSFLGLGVPPPTPSWGAMAADGFHAIRIAPHIVLAPAIALTLTLMAFNFLGDGLRDALDPRQKR